MCVFLKQHEQNYKKTQSHLRRKPLRIQSGDGRLLQKQNNLREVVEL